MHPRRSTMHPPIHLTQTLLSLFFMLYFVSIFFSFFYVFQTNVVHIPKTHDTALSFPPPPPPPPPPNVKSNPLTDTFFLPTSRRTKKANYVDPSSTDYISSLSYFLYLSVRLSVYLFIYLSVRPSVSFLFSFLLLYLLPRLTTTIGSKSTSKLRPVLGRNET